MTAFPRSSPGRTAVAGIPRSARVVQARLGLGSSLQGYGDYYRGLKSTKGGTISLAQFQGRRPVVVFFYPKAGTPGCTKEVCSFRDALDKFKDAGAQVVGISSDSPVDNAGFARRNRLNYPLLSDEGDVLRRAFGVKGNLLGLLPGRQTFVIDKNGYVRLSFNDQFGAEKHVGEALEVLKQLA